MQIEIYKPTHGETVQPVEWNFTELKNWITDGLKKYEGLVYTESTMTLAKKDRADLNRLSKAINDKRIEMKRMFLSPYEEFERQAKELTGLIDAQSAEIDRQVKVFEQAEKDAKQAKIKTIYAETIGDLADLIPYEKIHDPKWLNKGTNLKAIREAIEIIVSRAETAFTAINAMGFDEPTTNRVKAAYLRRFELADAMAEKQRIEEENKRLAEYELKKQAEARAKAEAQAAAKDAESATEPPKTEIRDIPPMTEEATAKTANTAPEPERETPIQMDFRVWATRGQLNALKEFLVANGIKYGRVQ